MIKYNDISLAINSRLKTDFSDIKIQSLDIKEGFKRPSFFVEFDSIKTSDFMSYLKETNLGVKIYYFPSDPHKNKSELFSMMSNLESALLKNLLMIDDFSISIDEVENEISDGVLISSVKINLMQEYDDINDDTEFMESVDIKI